MDAPAYPLLEFVLTIAACDISGSAYPDTGFEGGLIIPVGVGRELVASGVTVPWRLADGSIRTAQTWNGVLELEEHSFRVQAIAMGNRYLIGREILDQLEICFQFGRRVVLRFA